MFKKIAGGALAVSLVAGGLLLAAPANADEEVTPDETAPVEVAPEAPAEEVVEVPAPAAPEAAVEPVAPETPAAEVQAVSVDVAVDETPYVLVGWRIPNKADVWEGDQTIAFEPVDLQVGELSALDELVAGSCGYFQIDLYNDSPTTRALIAGGVLHDANNPQEDLAFGAVEGNPYKYLEGLNCAPPVTNSCEPATGTHSTNLADLWQNVDTRSKGHVEYVEGGLHVWTEDSSSQSKVSEGIPVNFPLHDTGVLNIDVTAQPGNVYPYGPGLNLFVDITGDGAADGTLVYETVYGQDLWVTNGSAQALKDASTHTGGNGSENHGTIDHYLLTFPDATVVGLAYSLGSGVQGDWVINSITAGCATHTFDFEVLVPEEPVVEPTVEVTETVDCETSTVTTTTTTTTPTFTYDAETNTWVAGEPTVEVTSSERPATAEECPVIPPTEEEPPAPAAQVSTPLAQTGGPNMTGWAALGVLSLLAGAAALVAQRRRAGTV